MNRFDAKKQGYRMPAEWEKMQAMWLGWPVLENREELWGKYYEQVCLEFALVAKTITKYQPCIVTAHHTQVENARKLCGASVEVIAVAAEDNWLRDCASTSQGETLPLPGAVWLRNSARSSP